MTVTVTMPESRVPASSDPERFRGGGGIWTHVTVVLPVDDGRRGDGYRRRVERLLEALDEGLGGRRGAPGPATPVSPGAELSFDGVTGRGLPSLATLRLAGGDRVFVFAECVELGLAFQAVGAAGHEHETGLLYWRLGWTCLVHRPCGEDGSPVVPDDQLREFVDAAGLPRPVDARARQRGGRPVSSPDDVASPGTGPALWALGVPSLPAADCRCLAAEVASTASVPERDLVERKTLFALIDLLAGRLKPPRAARARYDTLLRVLCDWPGHPWGGTSRAVDQRFRLAWCVLDAAFSRLPGSVRAARQSTAGGHAVEHARSALDGREVP